MVSKDFVKLTDKLIKGFKDKKITVGNGNVIIAKPPIEEKTRGGIVIADMARELEQKRMGFAKVIAIPTNLDPDNGDIPVRPGDYVFFTFANDNPIHYKAIGQLTGTDIPKETLFFTSDSELIAVVDRKEVENGEL